MPKSARKDTTVRWEELTAPDFARAVRRVKGVCIIPVAVIEKHGDHLPLGTDMFAGIETACRAAALEPAIVFPPYYFGHIPEAKHVPGTVAIQSRLMVDLLENVCEEIARNGLRKVIFLNGHGGNEPFLNYFVWKGMARQRPYTLYFLRLGDYLYSEGEEEIIPTGIRHAGEGETSMALAARPDLVRMDQAVPSKEAGGRLAHLPPVGTGFEWYADWPDHYQGNGALGTAEKGEKLLAMMAAKVARVIKAVREDEVTEALQAEFFGRINH